MSSTEPTVVPTRPQATKVRAPWIAGGLLLLALSVAAALYAYQSVTQTAQAIATTVELSAGDPISRDAVRAVDLPVDVGLSLIPIDQIDAILEARVVADLPVGTLLSGDLLTAESTIGPGRALIGLPLEPGGYPLGNLTTGDPVAVIVTVEGGVFEVARGPIFAVAGDAGERFFTLDLPADNGSAALASAAAAAGTARLIAIPDLEADLAIPTIPIELATILTGGAPPEGLTSTNAPPPPPAVGPGDAAGLTADETEAPAPPAEPTTPPAADQTAAAPEAGP